MFPQKWLKYLTRGEHPQEHFNWEYFDVLEIAREGPTCHVMSNEYGQLNLVFSCNYFLITTKLTTGEMLCIF